MRISNRQKIRFILKIDEFYCDINHVIDYKNIVCYSAYGRNPPCKNIGEKFKLELFAFFISIDIFIISPRINCSSFISIDINDMNLNIT